MRRSVFALIVCVLLFATIASADIVVSSSNPPGTTNAGGFWNTITPTATGNTPGVANPNYGTAQAYWDHGSFDAAAGGKCNIGWIVTGQMSGCSPVDGPPLQSDDPLAHEYWSVAAGDATRAGNGNYDPNFVLYNNNARPPGGVLVPDTTELELRITGYQLSDIFGWYESDSAGAIGALHPLFNGTSHAESFGAIITGTYFGFYVTNGDKPNANTFYTTSSGNTVDAGIQHFAVMRVSPTGAGADSKGADHYYIGVEDLGAKSDFDYNDMVIEITQVPEPTSVLLFGTLLAGAGLITRRLRKS